ncbi:MAG: transglycosylase SLT domain-containing protein [Patescibacteria group bacterium]|nr:transglycosylase SLT domain-containing protein [Patescibacteria group bacterium]
MQKKIIKILILIILFFSYLTVTRTIYAEQGGCPDPNWNEIACTTEANGFMPAGGGSSSDTTPVYCGNNTCGNAFACITDYSCCECINSDGCGLGENVAVDGSKICFNRDTGSPADVTAVSEDYTTRDTVNNNLCCCYTTGARSCDWFSVEITCPQGTEISDPKKCETPDIVLQVPIGTTKIVHNLSDYIAAIYNYALYAIVILAVVMIIYAGFMWILAAGNASKIDNAKTKITEAIVGLILAFASYLILYAVNPEILSLHLPGIEKIVGVKFRESSTNTNCPNVIGQVTPIEDILNNPNLLIPEAKKTAYDGALLAAANKYNVDCDWLKAIMFAESRGVSDRVSPVGACGLMQVLPATTSTPAMGLNYSCDDLQNVTKGIEAGAKYISILANDSRTKGNFNLVAAAYNGGIGADDPSNDCPGMLRWQCGWDDPNHTIPNEGYKETRDYVCKTQGYLNMIITQDLSCNVGGGNENNLCLSTVVGDVAIDTSKWDFDQGIINQVNSGHASPQLAQLINCMRNELDKKGLGEYRITSISDNAILRGNCQVWSAGGYTSACAHSINSCHYGGRNCVGQSYAADFSFRLGEDPAANLRDAAKKCGASAFLNEGDHLHISVGEAAGCGCDLGLDPP